MFWEQSSGWGVQILSPCETTWVETMLFWGWGIGNIKFTRKKGGAAASPSSLSPGFGSPGRTSSRFLGRDAAGLELNQLQPKTPSRQDDLFPSPSTPLGSRLARADPGRALLQGKLVYGSFSGRHAADGGAVGLPSTCKLAERARAVHAPLTRAWGGRPHCLHFPSHQQGAGAWVSSTKISRKAQEQLGLVNSRIC